METPLKQQLLETLEDLGDEELKLFHWYLQNPELLDGFSAMKKSRLQKADRPDTVDLMVNTYTPESVMEVMSLILKRMKKNHNQSEETFPKEQKPLPKLIPNADDVQTDRDKDIYPVTEESVRSRVALLINNMHFPGSFLPTRKGSEKDELAMQNLLTGFGYEVLKYKDLSTQEMDDALVRFC
ncbi:caspase-4-like [Melanotaenia boesemani]|uniref:caspase-4-like n=1 Tax=Melanotaenia boesemani TaxID=1250792 RepID=UPI001C051C38|nr:caspase-4-like [Melanotaenia boesemani]